MKHSMISVAEALSKILDGAEPITEVECLPLSDVDGRILAAPMIAKITQPPFDASAMDGYAVIASDCESENATLDVIGISAAGHGFDGIVNTGQAVRIFTGAPVPDGADAVLIQENTQVLEGSQIRVLQPVAATKNIRPMGQDFAFGESPVDIGTLLNFRHITLAAAMNCANLTVFRKPHVAILATGDELVTPGSPRKASQIITSNAYGIAALAKSAGANVTDLGIVKDDLALIREAIRKAAKAGADVLVTLGGASVGDHDLVQEALKAEGMNLTFWKVAMRPGKPLMHGAIGKMQVLGLPGNPVASLVCSLLYLEPLIAKLGQTEQRSRERTVALGGPLPANDQRQDYLRGKLVEGTDGTLQAVAFDKQDSSMMKTMAEANCLIIRQPHAQAAEIGDSVEIIDLR
jgi:molybdopterin molybdotransferase